MYTIAGRIEGLAPLLYGAYTDESLEGIETGGSGGKISVADREAVGANRYHRDESGQLIIPGVNMKKCILEGCAASGEKYGRKALTPFVAATVFVKGNLPLGIFKPDYVFKTPGKRPPKTGGACMIYYPAVKEGWSAPFTLTVVDDRRDPKTLRHVVEEAGLLKGLGPWRPEYGRFALTEWEVVKA